MWVSPHLLKVTIYSVGSGGQLSLSPSVIWNTAMPGQGVPVLPLELVPMSRHGAQICAWAPV